jgi:biofilm PGA synthesis N-glycosyltransferase PgaC
MKSVCLLVQNVYDADPRVRRKAEALVAAGYTVDVLALRPADGRKRYTLGGVNVDTLSLGKKRGSLARYVFEYVAFAIWALVRTTVQMRRRRYSIVEINTLPDFLVFAAIGAKLMGATVILDMHEIAPEFYMSKYGIPEDSAAVRLVKFLERISFGFADHVITINEPIEDLLNRRGLPRSKSTVVMNAADEARFRSPAAAPVAATAPRSPTFVMMYHGTLTKIYGLDIAVEALAMAHPDMADAELWILGSGPEAGALAALAERRGIGPKVKLLGQIAAADVPAWLQRCDVGILPIRRDVFLEFASPNKLPEYIIAGKAVIVSHLKAIRHYFGPDALAYFEPNNPADLARQMVALFRDPALCRRLADRAREEYVPIRWEVMKRRYLDLIDGIARPVPEAPEPSRTGASTALAGQRPGTQPTGLRNAAIASLPAYVLITPAHNEAQFIERTIQSVVAQSVRPLKWVIVSDGSTDGTDQIVGRHAARHDWIELLTLPARTRRNFAGKVAAFNAGYARTAGLEYDVIGNLDGDVSFEEDYLAFLIGKFAENPRLGVAGTPYLEDDALHDDRFKSPAHVSGACQLFRRACFEDIGGYAPVKSGGIDLIALLSAQAKGWQTRRFDEKTCRHHRSVGSGQHAGICARLLNHGRKDYLLGSHPGFEVFRGVYQMKRWPYVIGGALMLIGYFWALVSGAERSMPEELIELRRSDQLQRLKDVVRHPLRHRAQRVPATIRS